MSRMIKMFGDGSILEYDRGKFDDWCVYFTPVNAQKYAPTDVQYFNELQQLSKVHGARNLYDDFSTVFDATNASITTQTLTLISTLAAKYGADAQRIDELLTIVYAGMVAEENKQFTRLGKRVKRLGLHQVLLEGLSPQAAAYFSKGKRWREIASECEARGF